MGVLDHVPQTSTSVGYEGDGDGLAQVSNKCCPIRQQQLRFKPANDHDSLLLNTACLIYGVLIKI